MVIFAGIMGIGAEGLRADTEQSTGILRRDTLTGDWGGLRTRLEEKGIRFELSYTGEMFSILSGGLERKTVYLDNKDFTMSVDAGTLMGWKGAGFFLYVLGNHGTSPSRCVGDLQVVSNIDAPNTFKVYEAWYRQSLFGGALSFKIGLYDVNSEFDVIETCGLFNNSSFGIGPDFSQSGLNGPSIFPTTSLGLRIKVQPLDGFYIQSVVLDGVPGDPDNPRGTHIILKEDDGLLIAGELGYRKQINGKYNKVALGAWFYTGEFRHISEIVGAGHPQAHKGNKGFYFLAERRLYCEKKDNRQGLCAFFRVGGANRHVNQLDFYLGAGIVYSGLVPGRDKDLFGLAVAYAHNGSPFMRSVSQLDGGFTRAETAVELTYRFQVTPWFGLKPGFQYIIDPGTDVSIANAFNFSLRSEINF
jgi:porin